MAHKKKIEVSGLNIRLTTKNHTSEDYVDLLKFVQRLGIQGKIAGNDWGELRGISQERDYIQDYCFSGDILRFTVIGGWFDTENNSQVSDRDLKKISIPEKFRANGQRLSFLFFPEHHLLFFEAYADGKRLGPTSCERLMKDIFSDSRVREKFGDIEVTKIPDRDSLDEAFEIYLMETLSLRINRPNPDGFAENERRVLERMARLNVRTIESSYKSVRDEGIDVDEDLRSEADIAARNGKVYLKGKDDEGRKKEFDTSEHPVRRPVIYDEEVELGTQAFFSLAKTIKDEVVRWINS
ncbi:DUF4747 family protein [Marinobacter sp. P4B1]|uniref:DUF4747 family protein n=1 Tax=Marinobacter sp. P4B1 TaxID=1119533 RepID=UPI00071DA62D|nr:DUF4747 family protein [Marinobacter sp. P4B1]KRW80859.1 hypothetical protein AQ621_01525 [Marinobacter sp. P4B1]|tara:strand:+ start:108 stop:995 length:888 start_codon:yes stop_codon:yes gene_type:complete